MSPKIEYPKRLPDIISKNIPLESGFTPTEIVTLQNMWRLIKRRLNYHSSKMSTDEHYFVLERFRNAENKKINLRSLHQHIHQIMKFYERLIEDGLNDVACINVLLSDLGNIHKLYGITHDDIKLTTNYIKQYLINALDKIKSPTLFNGLEKLSELINEHQRKLPENGSGIVIEIIRLKI